MVIGGLDAPIEEGEEDEEDEDDRANEDEESSRKCPSFLRNSDACLRYLYP